MAGFRAGIKRHCWWVFAGLAILLIPQASLAENVRLAEGQAFAADTGELLYREEHRWNGPQHRIEYRSTSGELIAANKLFYRYEPWSPDFEQRELHSGYTSGVSREAGGLLMVDGDRQRNIVASSAPVISSGFDRFIQVHWPRLTEGETIDVDYALVSRLRLVKLRVSAVACEKLSFSQPDIAGQCFRVKPARRLLSMLAPPVALAYDEQRRLRIYRGQSNLRHSGFAAKLVEINYHYPAAAQSLNRQAGVGLRAVRNRGNYRYEL